MHLVQILLPLYDNEGRQFDAADFDRVRDELTERFGGVTSYRLAPAEGLWKDDEGEPVRDRVVIFEVMCERLDRDWWAAYRARLARRFRQDELVVRATEFEQL